MNKITIKSPAKINLYLRLMGKRRDGFNNLVTVFHKLALSDELTFEKRKQGCKIETTARGIPRGKSNLIFQAYELLRQNGLTGGVSIKLKKKIPSQGGLGGASSNAAATFIALNRIYNIGLRKNRLLELGSQLGSDIPFFLTGDRLSLGIDRGEKLVKLDAGRAKFHFILFIFKAGLATPNVYKNHHYGRRGIDLTNILHDLIMLPPYFRAKDISAIAKISYNDLVKPATRLKPEIFSLINRLKKQGAPFVQMTGSGATVFSMFSSKREADRFCENFTSEKDFSLVRSCSY